MSGFFYALNEHARLLFVDDDPILREFAQVNLASALAGVDVAADGVEAIEALSRESYDVVLVDLHMPRMDGLALLTAIRQNPSLTHLPVIVETGREDVESIDRAYQAGATGFVTKPLNWRLLGYQIHYVLRSARTEAALRGSREDAVAA
ncbi:MAG: response regulator [Caulobacteraceae bacterium]|nr:response regulator [Caulobacteraceae bacterium]